MTFGGLNLIASVSGLSILILSKIKVDLKNLQLIVVLKSRIKSSKFLNRISTLEPE